MATTRLHLSLERARALYKSRWRIEEGFRRWKSDFNLCRNVVHSLHSFKVDVQCAMLAHAVTRLMVDAAGVHVGQREEDNIVLEIRRLPAFRAYALDLFGSCHGHTLEGDAVVLRCIQVLVCRVVIPP